MALMEATVKYGIVYWCPLIIRSMVVPSEVMRPNSARELRHVAGLGASGASGKPALLLRRALLEGEAGLGFFGKVYQHAPRKVLDGEQGEGVGICGLHACMQADLCT